MMLELQPIPAKIITFYSFKGGVGRSMAMYNCACILAGAGRRVLMVDMDLEAPGLSFFLHEQEKAAKPRKKKARAKKNKGGMVEIITTYIAKPDSWPLRHGESPTRIEEYCQDVDVPKTAWGMMGPARLALLPAGRMDDGYEQRLSEIQWDVSPLCEVRDNLFLHLREVLRQSALFDYVLIDARTGWSDESYVAARFMADDLVVLSGLNTQNVLGTARFLRHVDTWNEEEEEEEKANRVVILVGSPVPLGEEAAKKERREQVRKLLEKELGRATEFTLTLSYNARLALYEEAIVANWPDTPLAREYRQLTQMLRELAQDNASYWADQMTAAQQAWAKSESATGTPGPLPSSAPSVRELAKAMAGLASNSEDILRQVAAPMSQAITNQKTPPEGAEELLRDLSNVFKGETQFMLLAARMHRRTGKHEDALACLEEAKAIADKTGNHPARQAIAQERGEICQKQKAHDEARAAFQEARKLAEETGAGEGAVHTLDLGIAQAAQAAGDLESSGQECEALLRKLGDHRFLDIRGAALYTLGSVRRTQARYEDAVAHLARSLEMNRELGSREGEAATLHELGNCARDQGRYDDAIAYYEQSLAIEPELGNQKGEAATLHGLGNCARSQGRYDDAIAYYEQSRAIERELGNWHGETASETTMGRTLFRMGRYEEARVHYEAALSGSVDTGSTAHENSARMCLAALDFAEGTVEKDALNRFVRTVEGLNEPYATASAWLLAAEAYVHRGLADDALEALDSALGWTMDGAMAGIVAKARAMRAPLLAERGKLVEAKADAQHAIAFFDAQDVRYAKRAELEALLKTPPKKAPKKAAAKKAAPKKAAKKAPKKSQAARRTPKKRTASK